VARDEHRARLVAQVVDDARQDLAPRGGVDPREGLVEQQQLGSWARAVNSAWRARWPLESVRSFARGSSSSSSTSRRSSSRFQLG
jgi:hypothetical protein